MSGTKCHLCLRSLKPLTCIFCFFVYSTVDDFVDGETLKILRTFLAELRENGVKSFAVDCNRRIFLRIGAHRQIVVLVALASFQRAYG